MRLKETQFTLKLGEKAGTITKGGKFDEGAIKRVGNFYEAVNEWV